MDGRPLGDLPLAFVRAAQRAHQLAGHRPVLVPVESDVSVQVILELVETSAGFHVELVDDPLKECRQQVLSAEREGRRDGAQVTFLDERERLTDERADAGGDSPRFERDVNRLSWRSSSRKPSIAAVLAPHRVMARRYSSKWLMKPPRPSSSLSSATTISLMKRQPSESAEGNQGTSTQLSRRCSNLSNDMKSQTAKTWFSRKRCSDLRQSISR